MLLLALAVLTAAFGSASAGFKLSSTAFTNGQTIPVEYTCDGSDRSPPLVWTAPPKGTKSLALVMDDPDAPSGTFVHWLAWNIPAKTRRLRAGAQPPRQGTASFNHVGYGGPCPPPGPPHHYVFKLYALRSLLALPTGAERPALAAAMNGKILKRVSLVGLYGR